MKSLKWIILGMLVVALAIPVNAADIGLTKGVDPANPNIYRRGETIHYVMTVENLHLTETIEVDLVQDTLPDGTVVTLASGSPAFSLGPGGIQNFMLDFLVPSGATGIIVNDLRVVGRQLSTVPDEFDAHVTKSSLVIESCLSINKTADPLVTKAEHDVIYTIEVCNCGEDGELVELQLVSIIDTLLGDLTGAYSSILPVSQCESRQFLRTVLADDPDPLINEVTANYVDITGFQLTACDIAEVDLVHPDFLVTKVCETDPIPTGADAEFRVTVTNIGDVALHFTTNDAAIGPFSLTPGGVFTQVVVRPVEPGVEEVCNEVAVIATLPPDLNLDNVIRKTAGDCCPVQPLGDQGCTPGFWKNNADKHEASAWVCYSPSNDFSDVFGIPEQQLRDKGKDVFSNPTLLQALNANGGGINALARHATAALLNISSGCVSYPMSEAGLIAAVQDAIAADGGAIQALKNKLAEYNEAGCPVNQHGECMGPDVDG